MNITMARITKRMTIVMQLSSTIVESVLSADCPRKVTALVVIITRLVINYFQKN
jgi:hypothetical protein